MKYLKIIIENYRGIVEPIEINLSKNSLVPIIGVNESGKTTILQAIFAFDRMNDKFYNGAHLSNTENLYGTILNDSRVSAEIQIDKKEFIEIILEIENRSKAEKINEEVDDDVEIVDYEYYSQLNDEIANLREKMSDYNPIIKLTRNLTKNTYLFDSDFFNYIKLKSLIVDKIIKQTPYILYFDDFRDRIEDSIKLNPDLSEGEVQSSWLPIIQQMFKKTNVEYSSKNLKAINSGIRDNRILEVEELLNEKLMNQWKNFNLLKAELLKVKLEYTEINDTLKFKILETIKVDGKERKRVFGVSDRSKGFFWYFNFIMKLEFNPKVRSLTDKDTIYLLDEPGSYLHSSAQVNLAATLKNISKSNKVIYCTHSPYLLDPKTIPINTISIATKDDNGIIKIAPINSYKTKLSRKHASFQPILDALESKLPFMDYNNDNIILVEGIYDYYCFNMFKGKRKISFFPSQNADSIKHHISYMIFLGKKYLALWDNDVEGRKRMTAATKYFGGEEGEKFCVLPMLGNKDNVILQDLFFGNDIKMIKDELQLNKNTSFEKVIAALYHSTKKSKIITEISERTKDNFEATFELIAQKMMTSV